LIDEGRIVANGTFDELKEQQGKGSLEQIFANLTANDTLSKAADDLRKAFEN